MLDLANVKWDGEIIDAARRYELAFFVGNGLSRLSGAPSWGKLFENPSVTEALLSEKMSSSRSSYLECANRLEIRYPAVWHGVKQNLKKWGELADPSLSHCVLAQLFRPPEVTQDTRVLTSNVDSLLTRAGFREHEISYCHGHPTNPDEWIFSADKYWSEYKLDTVKKKFSIIHGKILLFIGYSHSESDFDVIDAIKEVSAIDRIKRIFSLNTDQDKFSDGFSGRLELKKISAIYYDIDRDSTFAERDMRLAHALLCLAAHAGFDKKPQYNQLRKICTEMFQAYKKRRQSASIVMGLAGTNRHLLIPDTIPTGGRRFSMRADVRVEAGGPGYIVSKILQVTGNDSYLVTKIGDDVEGLKILSYIDDSNNTETTDGKIFTDFIAKAKASSEVHGFRTWESFILEPGSSELHRVFLDRQVTTAEMDIPDKTTKELFNWVRNDNPRIMYFDKFFRAGVETILLGINQEKALSSNTWNIYETGSDGDRYSGMISGEPFDKRKAYRLERILSPEGERIINVVTASFRFARDFLAERRGKIDKAFYNKLLHRHDSSEITASKADLASSEEEVIDWLISDPINLEKFCQAIGAGAGDGANAFLREHDLRMVIVTLHRYGCIVIACPTNKPLWWEYVKGRTVGGRNYTASAGDVFRGVFVSALSTAQRNGTTASGIMEKSFALQVAALCNECAAHKVGLPTVHDALSGINTSFQLWKTANRFD